MHNKNNKREKKQYGAALSVAEKRRMKHEQQQ